MDLKTTMLTTPSNQTPPDNSLEPPVTQAQLESLQHLHQKIKQIKTEKNKLAAQFKHAKDDPATLKGLKNAMAKISRDLKDKESQRKIIQSRIRDMPSEQEAAPVFPPRFRQPPLPVNDSSTVTISKIDASQAADWNHYVSNNPRASLYHLYCWRDVIEESFGHNCHYYVARDSSGHVCGVLPLVAMNSRLFGHYAVSLPFFNYGGPLADSHNTLNKLMETARTDATRQRWQHVEYRCSDAQLDLPGHSRKVSMILPLPNNQTGLDQQLGSKVRAQYKQARQHTPQLRIGGVELLDDFYRVFSRAMRDLGTPVYSSLFFASILARLEQRATLICVYLNKRPVATALLLGFGDMLEIPWAATLREYNGYNINMWMYRQILGFAIDSGYDYFDFGRSTMEGGTYRFKKQWGASPLQQHWYYQLASPASDVNDEQSLPALNPDNPKYRLAIAAWKRLPLFVANTLGPHIVRNLP